MSVELTGFRPDTEDHISVMRGQTRTVDFAMEVGCGGDPPLVVQDPDFGPLLAAKVAAAHVHIADETVDRHDACGPKWTAAIPTIRMFAASGPAAGDRILLAGESGRFESGKEYLVLLDRPWGRKQPFFGAFWAREVVRGRLRGPNANDLGVRDGMTLEQGFERLRESWEKANRKRQSSQF